MHKLNSKVTDEMNFYKGASPDQLLKEFGSPLYVYNESILRKRCRDMKNLTDYNRFIASFSAKANSNLAILEIVRSEGLKVGAMSPGEVFAVLEAGFESKDILYVCNNVSGEEMQFAAEKGIVMGVDSVSQLRLWGKICPQSEVFVRFNPGIGAGHNEKVITGGKNTKFGIDADQVCEVEDAIKEFGLKVIGINQHIGSLFMEGNELAEGARNLIEIAKKFDNLEFFSLGGGYGIPYNKQAGEQPINLKKMGETISVLIKQFNAELGKELKYIIEPGRYVTAECGVILGYVNAVKYGGGKKYVGTDIGFNVLARPVMYDSHHDIEVYRESDFHSEKQERVYIAGNICESGDIIAADRLLPEVFEGDIIAVLDTGAYGHVMSSNYNFRLRPAEVLIRENGEAVLIRKRDTVCDILGKYKLLRE